MVAVGPGSVYSELYRVEMTIFTVKNAKFLTMAQCVTDELRGFESLHVSLSMLQVLIGPGITVCAFAGVHHSPLNAFIKYSLSSERRLFISSNKPIKVFVPSHCTLMTILWNRSAFFFCISSSPLIFSLHDQKR